MPREHSFGSQYARWSFLFAATGVILLLVGMSSARETYQSWKVDEEIQGLRAQVDMLEGRRLHLLDTLHRLQSPDALDKEARLRLGLQKPGEQVFILRDAAQETIRTNTGLTAPLEEEVSNPSKWWRYFFHPS